MSPIFVAIDTPDLTRAREIARAVRGVAGGLKLGLEFFAANGPSGCRSSAEFDLPIFLDLKLHDIPNTVAKAVQALRSLEPAILTVHAAGGRAMLEDAKAAAPPKTKVVAVTVLTSLDERSRRHRGQRQPARAGRTACRARAERGARRHRLFGRRSRARAQGMARRLLRRPRRSAAGGSAADQKRVVTPRQAIDDGASILVIGRPITEADDPSAAVGASPDAIKAGQATRLA